MGYFSGIYERQTDMEIEPITLTTMTKPIISLSTIAGPAIHVHEDHILFQFGEKVICTVTKDSPEKEIFDGLIEFIACFKGNLKEMIAGSLQWP